MPKDRSLNIDDNYDFEIAKNYIKKIWKKKFWLLKIYHT
jgi:CMP-N-acetylneuraminic acid synthetase